MAANIVLYDRFGEAVTYENVDTITTDTPVEGETETFTHGIEEARPDITLNFAHGGDMVVAPDDDNGLWRSVAIMKPSTLISPNVAKDVDIAGVIGTAHVITRPQLNLKYIIPVQVYVAITNSNRTPWFGGTSDGSYVTMTGVNIKRQATTEQINMVLYPPQASVSSGSKYNNGSIVWSHQIDRNNATYMITTCTYTISQNTNGTINTQSYTSKGASSRVSSIATITRGPTSGFFANGAEEMAGWWRGHIFVYDSAYTGIPEVLKTNTYVTGYRINVVT